MFQDPNVAGGPMINAPTIETNPFDVQEAKIKRTLAMAEALRGRGAQQPKGQMVDGHFVAPSWAEQLVPLFNNVQAGWAERQADKEQGALTLEQQAGAQNWMQQMPQERQVTTQQPFQAPGIDEADAAAASQGQHVLKKAMQQPTLQERMLWSQQGQKNPLTKALAAAYGADTLIKEPERQAAREERTVAREDRLAAQAADREQRAAQAAESAALRREQMRIQEEFRKGQLSLQQAQLAMTGALREQAATQRAEATQRAIAESADRGADRQFRQANALRDDYTKATEKPREAVTQAQQVLAIVPDLDKMTAQDQMATTFAFMRMLDPGSVVRESEYKLAADARGLLDAVRNYPEQLKHGKKLTPTQVANMQKVAREIEKAMGSKVAEKQEEFAGIATRWKLDPIDVMPGYKPRGAAAGPPEGAVKPRGQAPAAAPATAGGPPPGAVRPR